MKQTASQTRDMGPRASGPAGSQFEVKVATHYALAVLAQTEAFGLPGAIVDRIAFQRRGQGQPLDDIIIKGTTRTGDLGFAPIFRPFLLTVSGGISSLFSKGPKTVNGGRPP